MFGLKMNPLKCAFGVQAGDFLGFVVHKKGIEINENKAKAIMEAKAPSTKKGLQSLLGKINFLIRFISNLSGKTQAFSPLLRLKKEDFAWGQEQQAVFDKIKEYLASPPILISPCRKRSMRFRIRKWALALTEYSLKYLPLKVVKGQVVADFIVDHSIDENVEYIELEPWKLYFDGSSHKSRTVVGMLIISPDRIPTKFKYKVESLCSNNESEYEALIAGLEILLKLGATRV
ncbi:hypothetical protein KIW84_060424 [Lathyrus oleraceus]|uniref:Reverse transcriptase/retrotransposon-derived protein RNase H-like domain-containing protein n=1 Tax=Pisum sativum TaxID=3888 RepID=A0A9D4W1C3_PEA|nr:hypothetical protein KIW84_060424 [Pisum sativum]